MEISAGVSQLRLTHLVGNSLDGVVLVAVLNQAQVMLRAGCRAAFTDRATE